MISLSFEMPSLSPLVACGASGQARVSLGRADPDVGHKLTCKYEPMTRSPRQRLVLTIATSLWVLAVAGYVYTVVVHIRLGRNGRPDFAVSSFEAVVYGAALFSAATVGLVVAVRRPRHPVGWLFLALGVALSVGGAGDAFALDHGVVGGNGESTAVGLAVVAGKASFIAWFGLLAAILHLTPTGRPASRRWGLALRITIVCAAVALLSKAIQDTRFEPPYDGLRNPWAVTSLGMAVDTVAALSILFSSLGLVVAAIALVMRFKRGTVLERRQLRWMTAIAVAMPLMVAAAVAGALADVDGLRTAATGGFVALIPITAGLSVQQYRLYDVDRILSRATAYMLTTLSIGGVYGLVVTFAGLTIGQVVDSSTIPAVVATGAAVTVAAPLHRRVQDGVDRRFDRRRYDARRMVSDHLCAPAPGRSIDATLAAAVGDPCLRVRYWISSKDQWVSAAGQPEPIGADDICIDRNGEAVARVGIGSEGIDLRLARELAELAVSELDNVRLRAALSLQLDEVRDSRSRIVSAQTGERRRLERNLHDGAQQRLLALAMQLRSAQLRTIPGSADAELLDRAVDEIGESVRELRDLANGLHPSVLNDGGLAAALDELAGRVPLKVELQLSPKRFSATIEETLWFVACEAVANTVKHARADVLTLVLSNGEAVRLICHDDGTGRANPAGSGLKGISDRVEAVGGRLLVDSRPGFGTSIEAVIPCASS